MTATATIFNKDSRLLCEIPDGTVDMVVTSPPFNISHRYRTYHDSLDYDDFENLYANVIASISRVLKADGYFIVDIADMIVMAHRIIYGAEFIRERALAAGLELLCAFPYIAVEGYDERMESSISRDDTAKQFHSSCEQLLFFGKPMASRDVVDNIHTEPVYRYSLQRDTAFWPENLVRDLLAPFPLKDKVLLDPFMGSGTIGRMVMEQGGRFIGYDIDRETLKTYRWI